MKIYHQCKSIEVALQNFAILWLITPLLNELFPYHVFHDTCHENLNNLWGTNLTPHSYHSSLLYQDCHNGYSYWCAVSIPSSALLSPYLLISAIALVSLVACAAVSKTDSSGCWSTILVLDLLCTCHLFFSLLFTLNLF